MKMKAYPTHTPANFLVFLHMKDLLKEDLLFSERLKLEKEFYKWCKGASTKARYCCYDEDFYRDGELMTDKEVVGLMNLQEAELVECRARKGIMQDKLYAFQEVCRKHHLSNVEELDQRLNEFESWKNSACHYTNIFSILSMDCQIVQEAIWDLEKIIDSDSEASRLLDDLKKKFDDLNKHRLI